MVIVDGSCLFISLTWGKILPARLSRNQWNEREGKVLGTDKREE